MGFLGAVKLSIYNLKGQLVKSYVTTADGSGNASLTWDGTDANGLKVDSGIYHYRMNSANLTRNGKIIMMK